MVASSDSRLWGLIEQSERVREEAERMREGLGELNLLGFCI